MRRSGKKTARSRPHSGLICGANIIRGYRIEGSRLRLSYPHQRRQQRMSLPTACSFSHVSFEELICRRARTWSKDVEQGRVA